MKELSIEEKVKRYDEAIAKGRQIQNTPYTAHWDTMKEVVEHLFPELKNEDERIRTFLYKTFTAQYLAKDKLGKWHGEPVVNILTWLEKKGEKVNIQTINEVWKDMRLEVGAQASGNRHEPQYSDNNTKLFSLNDIDKIIEKISEKQGSQNLANSVKTCKDEPKFKVGDWIVKNDGKDCFSNGSYVLQITSVDDNVYKLSNGCCIIEPFIGKYRLWTIKDAKDGNVLCTYECDEPKIVFILKGTPKKHYALSYYCYCNIMHPHFDFDSEKGCLAPNDEDVKPATQEQCDLLFQKMGEAGYKWDSEKKELRKIEQNPTWSEEDEKEFKWICVKLQEHHMSLEYTERVRKAMSWLEAFKERCTWKPSEQDILLLERIVNGKSNPQDFQASLGSLIGQLKKLK